MRRVTIIRKLFWYGRHTKYDYCVLRNFSDAAIQKTLSEMNKPYRSWFWEITNDFNLSRKSDQYDYAEYCLQCARDRFCRDYDSREIGLRIMNNILGEVEVDLPCE